MLVSLNITCNARLRKDGLFEIRPTINGTRVSIYGKTAEEIAQKYRAVLKGKTSAPPKSAVYLYAWLDEWLEVYKKPNVAENTYKNLERCARTHIKAHLKDKPLNRYTLTELTQALNKVETTRMRKYARGTLREAFHCAVVAGHIKTSPAENIPNVKHIAQKGKAIPLLDLIEMIQNASEKLSPGVFRYYLFCLFAGTRRDEALNLRGKDCDFKNRILHIPGTKTETSNRRMPMFPILEKLVRVSDANKNELVFDIGKYHANTDFDKFRGPESNATLHWLRHTFGTIQICIFGIPVNTVALWMGHSDASTTMQIYTHPEDLAPDIYFSGQYSESEKVEILKARYNEIISIVEKLL